jgi:Ca2+-binding RTX toxin-like protein
VVVDGHLNHARQVGCSHLRGQHALSCPLAGVDRIEVDMGPADDKVEVLDRLPIPLTAHLGAGSDKLIGNGERDTCYPEGTKRNRCIGGGGNDVCITGQRNSDCVGGPGDDYCKHGAGSDGCWGGPGNDVCYMGPGQDGCHGEGGDDRLYGGAGADQLYGGSGRDYCDGGPGVGRSHECETGPGH